MRDALSMPWNKLAGTNRIATFSLLGCIFSLSLSDTVVFYHAILPFSPLALSVHLHLHTFSCAPLPLQGTHTKMILRLHPALVTHCSRHSTAALPRNSTLRWVRSHSLSESVTFASNSNVFFKVKGLEKKEKALHMQCVCSSQLACSNHSNIQKCAANSC